MRDVAAHLTIAARYSYGQVVREMVRARGDWNRMIHDSAVREASLPVGEIVANLRSIVGSRRLAPTTSPHEPLLDLLVHGQDIALALGRERAVPAVAARDSAERVWTMRFPPRPWPLPKARLVATDIEWARGEGEEIRAAHARTFSAIHAASWPGVIAPTWAPTSTSRRARSRS